MPINQLTHSFLNKKLVGIDQKAVLSTNHTGSVCSAHWPTPTSTPSSSANGHPSTAANKNNITNYFKATKKSATADKNRQSGEKSVQNQHISAADYIFSDENDVILSDEDEVLNSYRLDTLEIQRQCIETNTAGQVIVTQDTVTSYTITSTEMSSNSYASSQPNDIRSRLRRFEAPSRQRIAEEDNEMFSIYDLDSGYNEASSISYGGSQYLTQNSVEFDAAHQQNVPEKESVTLNTKLTQSTTPISSKINNLEDDELVKGFATARTLFDNAKNPEETTDSAKESKTANAPLSTGSNQAHQIPEHDTVCPAKYTLRPGNLSKTSRSDVHTKERIDPGEESSSLDFMDMDMDVDIYHNSIEDFLSGRSISNSGELPDNGEKGPLAESDGLSKPTLSSIKPLCRTQAAILDKPSEVPSVSCSSTAGPSKLSLVEHCPPSTSRVVPNISSQIANPSLNIE